MKTEACRAALGQAKLALCFHIPSQASLHGIVKTHRSFCYANGPASPRNLFENTGLRLVSKRGCVVKKHPQARLRGSFHNKSSIRVANQHRVSCLLIRVHPSYPWLKSLLPIRVN
jgi:hypothetical protein